MEWRKSIIALTLLLMIPVVFGNNESYPGAVWYDEFDSITDWTCYAAWGCPSFNVTNFQGDNRLFDIENAASGIYLDSNFTGDNGGFCVQSLQHETSSANYGVNINSVNNNIFVGGSSIMSRVTGGVAGDDTRFLYFGSATNQDNDWSTDTWYEITNCIFVDYTEHYINDTLYLNSSYANKDLTTMEDFGFRCDGNKNMYFDKLLVWYGNKNNEPIVDFTPPHIQEINMTSPEPDCANVHNTTCHTNDATATYKILLDEVANCSINGTICASINSTVNICTQPNTAHDFYSNFTLVCNDSSGNSDTHSYEIYTDTVNPYISWHDGSGNVTDETYSGTVHYDTFGINCTDVNLNNISLYVNNTLNVTNDTTQGLVNGTWYATIPVYSGNYTINATCWDNISTYNQNTTFPVHWFNYRNVLENLTYIFEDVIIVRKANAIW